MPSDESTSVNKKYIAGAFAIEFLLFGLIAIALQHCEVTLTPLRPWQIALMFFVGCALIILLDGHRLIHRSSRLIADRAKAFYDALNPAEQDAVVRMLFVERCFLSTGLMLGILVGNLLQDTSYIQAVVKHIHPDSAYVLPTHTMIRKIIYFTATYLLCCPIVHCAYWALGKKDSMRVLNEFRRRRDSAIGIYLVDALAVIMIIVARRSRADNRPLNRARTSAETLITWP